MDISVLVVNLNNLEFTKDCVSDLMSQDCNFNLTIIDQNSSEEGTKEYFSTLPENIEFIQNDYNVNLNQLWNWFVLKSNTPYICLLNNDVRIAPNFLSSAIQVLEKEPNVGFVNHISNNKDYQEWSFELNYKIIETPYRQGWDPIFRKESYNQIPNELSFFYGDDYIYSKLYSSGMKGAYVLNSPMIHFERSTTVEKGGQRDASPDSLYFHQLDLEFKNMSFVEELSKWKPEFNSLGSKISHFYENIGENWFDYQELYTKMVEKYETGSHFVEVGSWKGRSSVYMAVEIINSSKYIKFDCVDIWEYINTQNDIPEEYFNNLYDEFLNNISPVSHVIRPIKKLSSDASELYNDNSLDFIFIDAAHDYDNVIQDIKNWLPKLKIGGCIAGHDYFTSEGIKKAVKEVFGDNYNLFGSCWIYENTVIKKEKSKNDTNLFDFCIFNNEYEILDIRLKYMSSFIDKFYVCEIDITHQSTPSGFYSYDFIENSDIAKKLIEENRLTFVRISIEPSSEYFFVEKNHRIEFSNWVKNNVKENYVGILSDCDEIISHEIVNYISEIKDITKLDLKMFYFTADNYSYLHPWNKLVKVFHSDNLKKYNFQTIRHTEADSVINNIGWHFSCFGGINQVIDKLKSFSHIEHNNSENTKREILLERLLNRKDYLGRVDYPCIKYNINDYPKELTSHLVSKKHLLYLDYLLKNEMKKTYITHVTRDYLEVALNLSKSIKLFSDLPLIVYCINLQEEDKQRFNEYDNVQLRNIDLDISERTSEDYTSVDSGNFYVNRYSARIYSILCAKTIAMEMALEEGWQEVCYLDSDCLATPLVDELFNWNSTITDYPIATEGIHEYMIWVENGVQLGNPFSGGSWPVADNKLCLEWPLMSFLEVDENQRGAYRTTGIMLMNQKCLPFIKTWRELCFILPKLVNIRKYATYHEETVYNVLSWKKTNEGFPLCYVNLGEGFETVKHFYSEEAVEGQSRWSDTDSSQNFYRIPDNKRNTKVLHGEKRTSEIDLILDYLVELKNNNYFND